ncbi:acidic mammalian chitinase-like [Haemaphysalis longicornis]
MAPGPHPKGALLPDGRREQQQLQHDGPVVSRWFPAVSRKHRLFLAVVSIAALCAATLFAFAGMTQQGVRIKGYDNEEGLHVQEDPGESMSVIKKAFEQNSNKEPSNVTLLCRFSPRYRLGIYPYGICTHFIYASVPSHAGPNSSEGRDVLYNYDPDAFRRFLHVRDTAPEARLLLSVELEAMLRTGWPADRLASDARIWLDRSGVDGLHLAGLDLLPRNVRNTTDIVTALRRWFKQQYLLTIGIDRTQKIVEPELLELLELVDFASFMTSHTRHTDERTTLTNPYSKYDNSTSVQFRGREIEKLAKLATRAAKSQICFTLTLGGNQFLLRDESHHGLGATAKHVRDASYAEVCRRHWTEVKYIEPAIGFYARSGRTWVGYDTERTIAAKVRLAMRKHPDFCVMLVQVDKDDFRGLCSEKHFPLVQSVKQAMRLYHRTPPGRDTKRQRVVYGRKLVYRASERPNIPANK